MSSTTPTHDPYPAVSARAMSITPQSSTAVHTSNTSSPASTKHEGILSKWTNVVRGWQNRWFVLDPVHCTLEYHLTEEDRGQGQSPRASIALANATIAPSSEDAQTFILHAANGEVYKFKAHDVKERQKWVNLLRCVISPGYGVHAESTTPQSWNTRAVTVMGSSSSSGDHQSRRGSIGPSTAANHPAPPRPWAAFASEPSTLRIDEPFAPARHVIGKIRDKRLEMCTLIETVSLTGDTTVSALSPDLLLLKSTSLASWDCLHRCLFALMNTDVPESSDSQEYFATTGADLSRLGAPPIKNVVASVGTEDGVVKDSGKDSATHSRSSSVASPLPPVEDIDLNKPNFSPVAGGVPLVSAPVEAPGSFSRISGTVAVAQEPGPASGSPLPANVASSSSYSTPLSSSTDLVREGQMERRRSRDTTPISGPPASAQPSRRTVFAEDQEEVTDVEEPDTGELGSVESEKSVILHLIGQLKIGMDLTKVTLPTFILERRSLLEMFADYMGHAYVLLRIPDMETEEQRMLGVLEWYLTSIHIVRKGTQAKKPYNPIIGETFHCSFKVPSDTGKNVAASSSKSPSSQSPSPSKPGDLLRLKYVGEQVSHHPPVTAFYAECPEKQICMNASIYTQSKFYGLSIGVNMVGQASLSLVQFGEEYSFTLPSAYARSILTVPWCELGGKVQLECKKSGYAAEIVFHTKPFYGGKLHRVTAEVTNPAGKVICKVTGEWNGTYEFAMTADALQKNASKSVDVTSLPVIRKRVRPIEKQDPFESRRLWKKVTDALATENIELATQEKNALEEVQRREEKQRKSVDQRYSNKYFRLEDGNWFFNEPLTQPGHRKNSRQVSPS